MAQEYVRRELNGGNFRIAEVNQDEGNSCGTCGACIKTKVGREQRPVSGSWP